MNRNVGVSVLIFCFGLTSIDAARATEIINSPPIIVQPYGIQTLNQQMLDQDRMNRDEEIEIQQLIEQNNKLTQDSLAHENDEGLAKINQTMLSYRNALIARDKSRIIANSEKWLGSRYGDLVALTEEADDMTVHHDLVERSDMLAQKYQMLSDLKDEMTDLNDKLSNQKVDAINQKQSIIDGYKKVAQEQQDKIQILVGRLDEMDKKISRFDDIIAQKDHQISKLNNDLASARGEVSIRDAKIEDQKAQVVQLGLQLSEKQNEMSLLKSELEKNKPQENDQAQEIAQKQEQIDLLKEELENKITELKNQKKQIIYNLQSPRSTPDQSQINLLKDQIQQQTNDLEAKDRIIKSQADQMEMLSKQTGSQNISTGSTETQAIDFLKDQIQQQAEDLKAKDKFIKSQTELMENLSGQVNNHTATVGSTQNDEVDLLKGQLQQQSEDLKAKDRLIKFQSDQMNILTQRQEEQHDVLGGIQSKIATLKVRIKSQMQSQADALRAKDNSIRWLNQVLAASQNKTAYFKLTAQEQHLSLQQAQDELKEAKDDLARQNNHNDQFENTIATLNKQLDQLNNQLAKRENQVELLKEELENKITELKDQKQLAAQREQDLKAQLQDKDNQINIINAGIQSDDRVKLAQQLIGLQEQESSLLDEKSTLALQQYDIFDRHYAAFENKMNILLANRRLQDIDVKDSMEALKSDLTQKQQEIDALKQQIEEKIANGKNQDQLQMQMDDLKSQLQEKENQINDMKTTIRSGQGTDTLKQELADEQSKADQLKQELDTKTAQSGQMTMMLSDYQKKLESKNNAYNEQLGQIAQLNARLQQKEAQVIKIKKDMYDLENLMTARERNAQVKDLSLSTMQMKVMDDRVKGYQDKISQMQAAYDRQALVVTSLKTDLALARQELKGMPSSDEIEFLRTGLKKANLELKQKDDLLLQTKANADEYEREYKQQSMDFTSLKTQLQDAYDELHRRNEDLKYKNLEVVRLKEQATIKEGDLQDQIKALTQKLDEIKQGTLGKIHGTKVEVLEAQLMSANLQIKDLHKQIDEFILPSKKDPLKTKLKQALDKIDELGRMVTVLSQKLQECGQSPNVTR